MSFYVYRYIRTDKNTPFYVGKGKGDRAFVSRGKRRNIYFNNITQKTSFYVEIILDNLSELQAFEKEIEFITLYKSLGYCEANLTNGGLGHSGYRKSEETKLKLSKSLKKMSEESKRRRRESLIGRPVSEATRKKLSEKNKNKKLTQECKDKISKALMGHKRTKESIEKTASKLRNRKRPKHIGEAVRAALKGKPKSPETIAKRVAKIKGQKRTGIALENIRNGIKKKLLNKKIKDINNEFTKD